MQLDANPNWRLELSTVEPRRWGFVTSQAKRYPPFRTWLGVANTLCLVDVGDAESVT
jgi:hypothetical protein